MTQSNSLANFASQKLRALERRKLRRHVTETRPLSAVDVVRNDKRLTSFSSNDYLGLTHHPDVIKAAVEATHKYGTGAGASRLVTGNHPLFSELERKLAKLKGTDDAVVMGSGYLTNIGVIPVLMGPQDIIFSDELCHACILSGNRLSGAAEHLYRHNNLDDLRDQLAAKRDKHRHALIVTDGVFSMDGDLAPIAELIKLADEFDAWLMTDDAHGIGVLGGGHGSSFSGGDCLNVPLQMGTLSKAIGSYGGYLCASQPVVDLIRTRCRSFIYSTGLSPSAAAAAIAALDLICADPELSALPIKKARLFTSALNLPDAQSPIVPIILHDTERTMAAAKFLESEGYLVVPIRPPTVPVGTSRLRIAFSAAHKDADVKRLAELVQSVLDPSDERQ